MTNKNLLTTEEAAHFLGLKPSTLHQWRWLEKELPFIRRGRFIRYRLSDLEQWLADGAEQAAPPARHLTRAAQHTHIHKGEMNDEDLLNDMRFRLHFLSVLDWASVDELRHELRTLLDRIEQHQNSDSRE
jgi:excisionase family DNA binding protein